MMFVSLPILSDTCKLNTNYLNKLFQISTSTDRVKRAGSEHLRNLLKSEPPPSLKEEHRIYIALPSDEAHQNTHDLGQVQG